MMTQTLATDKKHAAEHRRDRFAYGNSTAASPRERDRELFDMLRPRIINRFCPEWFSQRIWEDDGGGGELS